MHFVFYPEHEYRCPQMMHCPHLGGAALGSLVLAADEQTEWTDALQRQIDALRAEDTAKYHKIRELTARVEQPERELKAERQKQFQQKKRDTVQEEGESTAPQVTKKRGAPVGHPGWYRPRPVKADETIDVAAPERCPHCKQPVKARPDLPVYDHIQEDWIDGQRRVVCYRDEAGRCRKCRCWVQQLGRGEFAAGDAWSEPAGRESVPATRHRAVHA